MVRSSLAALFLAGVSATAHAATPAAGAVMATGLIAHRAIYDLELKDASERSGISGMSGRMVYEFDGDYCTGYTTKFRFVTQIDTGDAVRVSDQQTNTFENLKDRKFTFDTKSFTDDQLDKEVNGAAQDQADGTKVDLKQPSSKELQLAASRFPTEHMMDVIKNAKAGTRLFEARVFDGSDDGDKALATTTVVGKAVTPVSVEADAGNAGAFSKTSFWPVTISYFNENTKTDALPVYRMSFKLYENGITRDLTMDYGDFVLTGKLSKLELLDAKTSPVSNCTR
ncbi:MULTISPECIES: cell envelope integrity EipB family protein [unclassified Rhizobium]|uniref:cell envelope integrity EipB family protein n=1 Tax=unclassified Rhizobium TaxID=2613769 RepID=UPI00035CB17D|nr:MULTISPECIES: cell envelope integrity EipB family protein [unclassified Rhizobium]MBO9124112.1 cell envelope integrity EipB family protein [Rhizobium sp. 16-488-2b]MBO9174644.1 cell envelope integrity EipB family protein [Rhizobium sp. 16-488-2a]